MKREYLAANYSYFRAPNIQLIILTPLVPSLLILMFSSNIYEIDRGYFSSKLAVEVNLIETFLFFFKLILSVITSFFLVYRWTQYKDDGSLGYWMTQRVNRNLYILVVILAYAFFVSLAQSIGLLIIISYFGLDFPLLQVLLLIIGVFLSNILLSTLGILIADNFPRPEIAGLVYVILASINYTLNTDSDSILFRLFRLENNFNQDDFFLYFVVEILMILIMVIVLLNTAKLRDINL